MASTIGWKFYLCFIIPGIFTAIGIFCYFPDTKGLALEEVAALFGDRDEMAVLSGINIHGQDTEKAGAEGVEDKALSKSLEH